VPQILRKTVQFVWWVIRLGGVAGAIRDIYQVVVYLAAYGPSLVAASTLSTLDFAEQMPPLIRLAFFVGVFFCALVASGTAIDLAVSRFSGGSQRDAPANRSLLYESLMDSYKDGRLILGEDDHFGIDIIEGWEKHTSELIADALG
jgi:hypothetical protein